MGRRKSSTGGSEHDSESLCSREELGSRASGGRRGSGARDRDDDYEELEVDPFEAAVEQLYEKRASTRESALSTLVGLMATYRYDDCAFREDTLTQLFLTSVRRGKEAEACLAAKALGLHVTTLGASTASEGIYREAEPLLEPLLLTGKNAAVRVAVADALSILCFVGSEGAAETLHTMHTLWRVVMAGWKHAAASPVVTAALRSWAFLLTTVPSYQLDSHFVETHLGLLAQLLNGSDVDVRGAAGEAIALLWDLGDLSSLPESPRPPPNARQPNSLAALAVGTPPTSPAAKAPPAAPFGSPDASANGATAASSGSTQPPAAAAQPSPGLPPRPPRPPLPPRPPALAPIATSSAAAGGQGDQGDDDEDDDAVDSLEAIVERMRDLAKNRGDVSRLNKGDRASSRGTFRDLLAIIQGEYVPEQKVKLRRGDALVVRGLLDNIRFNYLRSYLADAFQSHLQSNELMHEVFRFSPAEEAEERLTPLEKRLFRSKSSTDVRDRTEQRRKERATMAHYKHSSLADYA